MSKQDAVKCLPTIPNCLVKLAATAIDITMVQDMRARTAGTIAVEVVRKVPDNAKVIIITEDVPPPQTYWQTY